MVSNGRTALITGANKGIGLALARVLGQQGVAVWLGCRDTARGETAAAVLRSEGIDATALVMDVSDDVSVARAAAIVATKSPVLDILVNNAGIHIDDNRPPSLLPLQDMIATYQANVFGPVRVTQALLPLLKASTAAHIVMIGSGLGSLAWQSDPDNPVYPINRLGYMTSKVALSSVTLAFSRELEPLGIKVNAADPGFVKSDFNGNRGTKDPVEAARFIATLTDLAADGPTGGFFSAIGRVPW